MSLFPPNPWTIYDNGIPMPWYTHPALEWINKNIPKDLFVLEIGGGDSSIWWDKNAACLATIEPNRTLCNDLKVNHIYSIHVPSQGISKFLSKNSPDKDFDIVIVDTDEDRESYVLEAHRVCMKYFIVDNWQQEGVSIYPQEIVDYLYQNSKEQLIFKQPDHKDWKTAIFIL